MNQDISEGDKQLLKYISNFEPFANDCLIVRDHETAKLVPFKFRKGQRILHEVAEKQKKEKGFVRILNLKARRYGGSTYVEGRFYKNTSMDFNRNTFIVGHEEESTSTLFRMAKLFHEQNPIAPSILSSNAQELRFDNKKGTGLKSEYRLATARNLAAGRSQGIHYLHISEEAFWPNGAEELLLGLFQCVPDGREAGSEIFRESTANGFGNTFQLAVFDAYSDGQNPYYTEDGITYAWSSPKTDWVLVFIPWFVHERYSKEFDTEDQRRDFIAQKVEKKVFDQKNMVWVESESSKLRRKFRLSYEKLHWRDWAIENKCGGSVEKFHQEYPATVLEAFLSKGSNFFDKALCDNLEENCMEPILVGDLHRLVGETRVKPNLHGPFKVWEKCKQEDSYFITVDVAGGIKKLSEAEKRQFKEPDRTNIDVWNHRTGIQAAQWNGHMHYDLVADLVIMIGEMYAIKTKKNRDLPIAAVELINHGYTVVANLEKEHYPQYEAKKGTPGWETNRRTKGQMVDALYAAARDGTILLNSVSTIDEMRTYIELMGEYGAASGCKDDRVVTAAIASFIWNLIPRKFKDLKKKKKTSGAGFKNFENRNKDNSSFTQTEVYYA